MSWRPKKIILPLLFFIGFFVLYFIGASRSIYGGDVGDLVTAAFFGGVPHPPGYPLFTVLGFLLIHLLPFFSPAFAVGLLSVVSGAAGVSCFYILSLYLSKSKIAANIASFTVGFSFLYWLYAAVAEVFALNTFFAILLFLLAILYRQKKKKIFLFLLFFVMGLSFTHHQTIILIIPSLILLIAKPVFLEIKKHLSFMFYVFCFLFLGLTPFLYIFIASSHHPLINWDNVHDLSSFFHLILRRDYGTFNAGVFGSPTILQRIVTLTVFGKSILIQLTIPVVFLTFIGFFSLAKKDLLLFVAVVLAWILSGPAFLAYAGFPLTSGFILGAYERFTLLSYPILLIPFATGIVVFSKFLASFLPKRNYPLLFQSVFLFIPLMLFIYNFPKTNLSSVNIGDTYAMDYVTTLPKNAVLAISGDTQVFNLWYMHYVKSLRPDVLLYGVGGPVIDNNPIVSYVQSLPPSKRSAATVALLEKTDLLRPIFSTILFQPTKGPKIIWMPVGLSYEMVLEASKIPSESVYKNLSQSVWLSLHVPTKQQEANPAYHNLTITEIPNAYADGLIATGAFFYSQYADSSTALSYFQNAKQVAPNYAKSYNVLGVLESALSGKCQDAIANFSQSLQLDSLQEMPYFFLYNLDTTCLHSSALAKTIASAYTDVFHKDFMKERKNGLTQFVNPLGQ